MKLIDQKIILPASQYHGLQCFVLYSPNIDINTTQSTHICIELQLKKRRGEERMREASYQNKQNEEYL